MRQQYYSKDSFLIHELPVKSLSIKIALSEMRVRSLFQRFLETVKEKYPNSRISFRYEPNNEAHKNQLFITRFAWNNESANWVVNTMREMNYLPIAYEVTAGEREWIYSRRQGKRIKVELETLYIIFYDINSA